MEVERLLTGPNCPDCETELVRKRSVGSRIQFYYCDRCKANKDAEVIDFQDLKRQDGMAAIYARPIGPAEVFLSRRRSPHIARDHSEPEPGFC